MNPRLTRRELLSCFAATAFGCTCEDGPAKAGRQKPPYLRRADVHLHLSRGAVARAIEIMNQEGIAWGVNLSGGPPGGSLEAQLAQAEAAKGRLLTFTSPSWRECDRAGFGTKLQAELRRAVALGARGLKIHKALGLAVAGPDGKLLAVDEPQLDALFDAAGELDVPVWIHTADPLAFWLAPDARNERQAELRAHPAWSQFGRNGPSFETLYEQLEHRFAKHPRTRFVSVHFGNCAEQPERVARTLRRFPNVSIDTAARVPELGRHSPELLRAFFDEFQDRILFGSDLGIGAEPSPLFLGSSGSTPPTDAERRVFFDATRRYFETRDVNFPHPTPIQGDWTISGIGLSPTVLEKLYVGNAARLVGVEAAPNQG